MTPDSVAPMTGDGPDPGLDQGVLALEEALAADAAGGPALGRVLGERRDLDGRAAGAWQQAGARPAMVTTTGSPAGAPAGGETAGPIAPNQLTSAPSDSRMPAMPPAGRPCGRTELAGKRSS